LVEGIAAALEEAAETKAIEVEGATEEAAGKLEETELSPSVQPTLEEAAVEEPLSAIPEPVSEDPEEPVVSVEPEVEEEEEEEEEPESEVGEEEEEVVVWVDAELLLLLLEPLLEPLLLTPGPL
jgi:hypothetical protein